jgi:hypothetical protein
MKWEEACKRSSEGWRLPTSKELNLIFEIKDILKNMEGWYYWTSDNSKDENFIICQDFSNGKQLPCLKDTENCVRLVRDI